MNTNNELQLDVNAADFLAEFKAQPNWMLWRHETRNGRRTKVPYAAIGGAGKTNDSTTWTTYEAALASLGHKRSYDGLGFVVTGGNVLIDLDGCRDPTTESIEPWAAEIVSLLNAPTEISVSGRGLHVYVKSHDVRSLRRMFGTGEQKRAIEIYAGGRYAAITFNQLRGTPSELPTRNLDVFIAQVQRGDF